MALVQLVYTKLQGITIPVDDAHCHTPFSSCATHIPISGSHLDGTVGAVGYSQEAHGLSHQLVSPQKASLNLALYLKPCIPPVPTAPRAPGVLLSTAVCTQAEDMVSQNCSLRVAKVRFCILHYTSLASGNVLSRVITL